MSEKAGVEVRKCGSGEQLKEFHEDEKSRKVRKCGSVKNEHQKQRALLVARCVNVYEF